MKLSRRHFLISGTAALGACFLPSAFLRRLARFPTEPAAAIDAPSSSRRTLYATLHDDHRWQLALGRPTTEYPSAPSWREWLADYESVDLDDEDAVTRWLASRGRDELTAEPGWLEDPLDDWICEDYVENRFLIHDSPEAHALQYLSRLKLAHGPLTNAGGEQLGRLTYYFGTMPGADSHFVEVEGEAILPALQHRLRELGEDTAVEIAP